MNTETRKALFPVHTIEPTVPFRKLACIECGALVDVIELPERYLDPDTYVGSCCVRVKATGEKAFT